MDAPRLLVVEDDVLVREMVTTAFQDGGYEVVTASTGDDALGHFGASDGPAYRALVTDINLGKGPVSGWDIAKRAREHDADIAVVYVTGDSAAEWASKGVPNSVLITKPFAPMQLLTAVSTLLNVSGGAAVPE